MKPQRKYSLLQFALALGSLGGASLILLNYFFLRGKYFLFAFAAYIVVTALLVHHEALPTYRERFQAGLSAFMVASVAHYVYVIAQAKIITVLSPTGHLLRVGVLLAFGALINLALARLTARPFAQS